MGLDRDRRITIEHIVTHKTTSATGCNRCVTMALALALALGFLLPNDKDQRPATADLPFQQTASRVRFIAWLGVSV